MNDVPVGQDDSTIVQRLLQRVVVMILACIYTVPKNGELLVEIATDERKQGDWRKDDVGHE